MTRRAVLFDLFGTLVPCYPLASLSTVLRQMAERLAMPIDRFETEWSRTFPLRLRREIPSVEQNIRQVLESAGRVCAEDSIDSAARMRLAFEASTLSPRPGALQTLARLRSGGVRVGLVSNCSMETVEVWETSSLFGQVDHATFSCVVRSEKPEPAIYLDAASALGVEPFECVFAGDGSCDELAGAARLGMKPVLVRADDDDGSFPGRIDSAAWKGAFISRICDIEAFVNR